jgi:hypothetical protein
VLDLVLVGVFSDEDGYFFSILMREVGRGRERSFNQSNRAVVQSI